MVAIRILHVACIKYRKKDDFPYHKHSTLLKNIQAEKKRQRIFGVISADVMKISKYENAVRRRIKIVATNDGTIIAIEMRVRTADIMNAIVMRLCIQVNMM